MILPYYYQELTCIPDQDVSTGFILGRTMDIVHLALVNLSKSIGESAACPIGVSFPHYKERPDVAQRLPIGDKIRLFARDEAHLKALAIRDELMRMEDYVHVTSIKRLEQRIRGFAIYHRRQPKGSKTRLIRRQMRRHGLTEAEASARYANFEERETRFPYVNLRSHSTGERFRLYVERSMKDESSSESWGFSTYGLGIDVAVPEF